MKGVSSECVFLSLAQHLYKGLGDLEGRAWEPSLRRSTGVEKDVVNG